MKDELQDLIDQEFSKLDSKTENIKDIEKSIKAIVDNQNKQVQETAEYRKKLFEILEKMKKMNIKVNYNDNMTTEELENIIKEVKI